VRIPVTLKIGVLTVATTAFYSMVGQLVPQKEVHPPEETELSEDMTEDQLLAAGREIMEGKGLCFTCHTVGKSSGPLRFPDLEGVGERAATRVAGLSAVDYLAQSLYEPNAYIVEGFNPGMPTINKPPVGLTDEEIRAVIAYLQSLGGEVTVTLDSKVWPLETAGGGGGPTAQKPAD
jgi:mono/diheme cytochrome c family protein